MSYVRTQSQQPVNGPMPIGPALTLTPPPAPAPAYPRRRQR